jgi:hypothetical protein
LSTISHPSSAKRSIALNVGNDPADRRNSDRFPFSAVSEAVEMGARTKITARVSDISFKGCYLDGINVFAPGTTVQLSIRHSNLQFDATAIVVYSLSGMGMGLTFKALPPAMQPVLNRWVSEVKGDPAPDHDAPEVNRVIQSHPRIERHILGRLIGLMMQKNILTREDGTELLDELLSDK